MTTTLDRPKLSASFDFRFSGVETLVVKVTRRCNLDCAYCYENITKEGDMNIEIFKILAQKAIESTSSNTINFLFHGGEPTLLPNNFYEQAVEYANELAEQNGKKVQYSMQTNLLFLTSDKLSLFKKHKFSIGASIDGPADFYETMRKGSDKFTRNYFNAIENGVRVGLLATINQTNFDKYDAILEWLQNTLKVNSFKANNVYSVGTGHNLPDMKPEQIFLAQKTIVDYLIKTRGFEVIEDNIKWQLEWYFRDNNHKNTSLCHSQKCGAGSRVLGITTTGEILPCGRFQWNDKDYYLGTLQTENNDFESKIANFHSLVPQNWYDCDGCEAKKICGYGCQAFISRSKSQANVKCLPTKMLYNYFKQNDNILKDVFETMKSRHFVRAGYGDRSDTEHTYSDQNKGDTYSDYRDYTDVRYQDEKTYNDQGYKDDVYSDSK
jgi:uncharacterized protein